MTDDDRRQQESIARDEFHDANYLGTDGRGATHWWSIYHQAVVVIDADAGETGTVDLPVRDGDTQLTTLRDWCEYTRRERGWSELRVTGGSIVRQAAQVLS